MSTRQSTPVSGALLSTTPGWVIPASTVLAWIAAVATALLFARAGAVLDGMVVIRGETAGVVSPRALTWTDLLLLALVAALATGAGAVLSQWAGARTERGIRQVVVLALFRRGVVGTHGRSGHLLSLATSAVERAATYRAGFLGPMTGSLTTPVLVLLVMGVTVSWRIAGVLLLLLAVVPLVIMGFRRLVRPIGANYRRTQGRLTAAFLETIQALDTLVYSRAADRAAARLAARGEEHRRGLMRLLAGNQLLILVVDAAFSLTVVVAAAGLAFSGVSRGTLDLGQAVAVVLMAVLVIGPVDVVGQFFYIGIAGRASLAQIDAHVKAGAEGQDSERSRRGEDQSASAGEIVFEGVTAGWPGSAPVLREVDLRVGAGERVALVGESGVGKSTASAVIQAHLVPRSGRAFVDRVEVSAANAGVVRSRLAVVEQSAFLFLGTISQNLRVAAPEADDDRLWRALEVAGMAEEVRAMPLELETEVGEHGSALSGGQAQRLSIARAWLRDAPILLMDEPTSQVDLAGEAAILAALERLAEGRTVLMIAHRPRAVLSADRVLRLTAAGVEEVRA
ncbi:ABC transporter ATP-binding protein [Brevibacterium litoralis]|uniref:ABC transporter ATP-binding protein n=1 Tax=Brevibacterium litoralis TaxID=3138935 RepID=UPI0032F02B5E